MHFRCKIGMILWKLIFLEHEDRIKNNSKSIMKSIKWKGLV